MTRWRFLEVRLRPEPVFQESGYLAIPRWYNRGMSRLNGDKSRHQINRKRVVLRRAKIQKLVEEAKARTAAGAKAPEKPSNP
jgi:hypothetical protein